MGRFIREGGFFSSEALSLVRIFKSANAATISYIHKFRTLFDACE